MPDTPWRVLVIGGGIGGLALAQALHAGGVDVQVHERDPEPSGWLQRYRININPHGARALHRCLPEPLWNAFVATSAPPGDLTFRTERLAELLTLRRGQLLNSADPADGQYGVSRVVLRNLLLAGLNDVVHFGARFKRFEVGDDGMVTAHFADGSTATGDVLVGADGAKSRVRAQYLPHAERVEIDGADIAGRLPLTSQTRSWLPAHLASGMTLVLPPRGPSLLAFTFTGRQHMSGALRDGLDLTRLGLDPERLLDGLEDYVLWAIAADHRAFPADTLGGEGAQVRQFAERIVARWHPALRRMVAETDPATVRATRFKRSSFADPWPSSPVTVLGDAVHNMPPTSGLGANTALRDAAELSGRLLAVGDRAELVSAIAAYEERMRDYGYAAVRAAVHSAERVISANVIARRKTRGWYRLCRAVPALRRRSFGPPPTESPPQAPEPVRQAPS
jgi:2-polyprenyl-6-methoxyphenol hydroxylase-like FAD-dependent oxidoreductase